MPGDRGAPRRSGWALLDSKEGGPAPGEDAVREVRALVTETTSLAGFDFAGTNRSDL